MMAACSPAAERPALSGDAEDGRLIAEENCARCHAIGPSGASPNDEAPPFRGLLARYDSEALATDLAEGIRIGHPGMPQVHLEARGVDALIAYLRTIDEPPPPSP